MSDEQKRAPGNVQRVTARNRKDQLNYGSNLFPPESPLTPDPQADLPASGEPLPFDEAAFAAQTVERFPPLPFDGDEAGALAAQAAQEAERFPPLPPPAWARHEAEAEAAPAPARGAPRVSQPAPARGKGRKPAPKQKPGRGRGCLYNLLTLLFVVLTIGAIIYGVYIFQNPYSPLNPLPPATSLPIMITATPGPQPALPVLDATPTPETALPTDVPPVVDEQPATPTEVAPTATYTPLPPEILTELAPTQEEFNGSQGAT